MLLKSIINRMKEKLPNSWFLTSKAVSTSRPLFYSGGGGEMSKNFLIVEIFERTGNA